MDYIYYYVSFGILTGSFVVFELCLIMPEPVVHHVELCVADACITCHRLQKYGFQLFAQRHTPMCKQLVVKLGRVFFVITERQPTYTARNGVRTESLATMCCEDKNMHTVDTVFNLAFVVTDVVKITNRVENGGGHVIQGPTRIADDNGTITYSIVKSICGNVIHTMIQKNEYSGPFLVGFETVNETVDGFCSSQVSDDCVGGIRYIDHVTLACYAGNSESVIRFYENCFGMKRFSISNNDDVNDGLILSDGVGLRLRAMEFWRCAETGLAYLPEGRERNPNSVMLVVVETLEGQTNCNIETYLREHTGPGIEHLALSSPNICHTVSSLISRGVNFRKPPILYYDELRKTKQIRELGKDISKLQTLGILLDNEGVSSNDESHKFLMQIFAHPLFDQKTFFIEVIERSGATGLGAGNILALVRSIREEERRKAADAKTNKLDEERTPEDSACPRRLC